MNYAVAGTGYTGRRVLARLPAGHSVGLNRRPLAGFGARVRVVDFDAASREPIALPEPCRLLYTVPPGGDGDDDARLAALLGRLASAPQRLVYLSTSGVYGDRQGALTDEAVAPAPATARARRRLAAETLLARWCPAHGTALTILRVPAIYGPGRLGVERLAAGEAVLAEADAGPGNRIHVDDLVDCCLVALTGEAPPGIYNVADGDHRSSSAFSRSVARLAGLPPPPEIGLAEARRSFSPGRWSFVGESRRLDTRRMRERLGVVPRYADPEDGIRASLAAEAAGER